MVRKGVAVLAGLFTAVAVIAVIETVSHRIWPPPPGIDFRDPEQLRGFMESLPATALLMVLAAWVIGTLAGGLVGCWIGRERPYLISGIIGAVLLGATVLNLAALPHPTWFSVAAVLGVIAAAWIAGRIATVTGIRLRAF